MSLHLDVIRACRRSRIKVRVYAALRSLGVALPAELADAANTTIRRVHAVMHGDGENFRHDTALVVLGVGEPVETQQGAAYALTSFGHEAWPAVSARVAHASDQVDARWSSPDGRLSVT